MPTSVALSPHFESFIRDQVESGRYNNVSEVVRWLAFVGRYRAAERGAASSTEG